jgi:hypothetical protein
MLVFGHVSCGDGRRRVMHICPVDDLVDLTYRQPFATGPAWTGTGLAGSR